MSKQRWQFPFTQILIACMIVAIFGLVVYAIATGDYETTDAGGHVYDAEDDDDFEIPINPMTGEFEPTGWP